MFENINLEYSILIIKSIGKKSFQILGDCAQKSRSTISRLLPSSESNFATMQKIAQNFFKDKKELALAIDDTLVKKIYSRFMHGSGYFYDTKIGKSIMAYRLLCSAITDGNYIFPLQCLYLFSSEFKIEAAKSKADIVKQIIMLAIKLFPNKTIIVVADGAFATTEILKWCIINKISAEMRMHKNRKVFYKGQFFVISKIYNLIPRGRIMARTIQIVWHDLPLYITAQKRIDKHGDETIVYQVSTYKAKPSKHVANYKKRWPIEKIFRTTKQHLGLQECFSTKMHVQLNHVSAVLLAYSFLNLEQKTNHFSTPEEALRFLKSKKLPILKSRINRSGQIFGGLYA